MVVTVGDGSSSSKQSNTHMANGLIKNELFTVKLVILTPVAGLIFDLQNQPFYRREEQSPFVEIRYYMHM